MRRLASLLVLPLLAACPGDDGTAEETGASATSTGTTGGGSTDTGEPGSSGPGATTTGNETGQPTPPDDSTGGVDPAVDACTAACEHLVMCGAAQVPTCAIPCAGINDDIVGCEDEYIAQQQCVVTLSCEAAQVWVDAMGGGGTACDAEDTAFYTCSGGGSG